MIMSPQHQSSKRKEKDAPAKLMEPEEISLSGTFWLTREVLLRFIAFIYTVAFVVAFEQNGPLLGSRGLLPAPLYMKQVLQHSGNSRWAAAKLAPSIFWLFDFESHIDKLLTNTALAGLALSGYVLVTGCANMPMMFALWALYHSIVNVGQRWYGFGWESQLLESGFLAIFLCPVWSLRRFPKASPPSFIVIFAFRWLLFRIMLGAGLIKLRGDKCWRDLTCMNYHYQTQPVPNPMAYFMHQEPEMMHKFETLVNHFVELPAPFLLLLPRRLCMCGGLIQIVFQSMLIISGNLSFLNWLTMLPALASFDDAVWGRFFSLETRQAAARAEKDSVMERMVQPFVARLKQLPHLALSFLLVFLSVPVLQNLVSSRQLMNSSFDSLRLVNTYGAFGSVTKERTEVILQGTRRRRPEEEDWLEFQFKCKPGATDRMPCLISPYHYRLDWLMWFAAFQDYSHNEWLVHLAAKLLANDREVSRLMAKNPFLDGSPPRLVRAQLYRYEFTSVGSPEARAGQWWKRELVREYLPVVDLASLKAYMKQLGWPEP